MSDLGNVEPLRRGNRVKREIYEEVGRAIVTLSDIENWMGTIYHTYAQPNFLSDHYFMPFFHELNGFEKKAKLATLFVRMFAKPEHCNRWLKIVDEIEKHRKTRNLIAHQGMSVYGWGEKETAILSGPWLSFDEKRRPKGKTLELEDIRATASALEGYRAALEKLWGDIDNDLYPPEDFDEDDEESE